MWLFAHRRGLHKLPGACRLLQPEAIPRDTALTAEAEYILHRKLHRAANSPQNIRLSLVMVGSLLCGDLVRTSVDLPGRSVQSSRKGPDT